MYLPIIDEKSCISSGDCEEVCPHVFHVEGVARVQGPGDTKVLAAAEECPTQAISVINTETNQYIYP